MQGVAEKWRDHGFHLDITELVYFGDRNEAAGYLAEHGSALSPLSRREAAKHLGDAPTAPTPVAADVTDG